MPHHMISESQVTKEKEKIRYEDLPQESVDNLVNALTVSQNLQINCVFTKFLNCYIKFFLRKLNFREAALFASKAKSQHFWKANFYSVATQISLE